MTLQELYSHYYIQQEIEEYKRKIIELRELAESITAKWTGMPSGGGKSDKVGDAVLSILSYTEMLEKAIQRDIEQTIKINDFILNIDDAQLRRIIYLRFIEKKTWQQVADNIGGNNTEDSVRKRCNRYIKATNKKLSDMSANKAV